MPQPDWRRLYPFCPREMRVGGHRMSYLDEGSGRPLLLVHGNPTWSFYWRSVVSALSDRYRLIVPDHIGCGLSDKPSAREYPYRLARRVADLAELVEKLDLRQITLIAHDWGGAIGMGAAATLPERFRRFVLMNTAAFRATRCPWRIRACRVPGLGRLAVQGLNLFARAATVMAVEDHRRMTPEVKAGLLAPYDSWAHRTAVAEFVNDIPLAPSHPSYAELSRIEAGLAQFREHPVCLIWGMRDWCFSPYFLERFLEFFPKATAHRLADVGHYLLEDAPERVTPLIGRFLDENPLMA